MFDGSKLILPGEFDLIILFAPISNENGDQKVNQGGSFSINSIFKVDVTDQERQEAGVINVYRPGEEPVITNIE